MQLPCCKKPPNSGHCTILAILRSWPLLGFFVIISKVGMVTSYREYSQVTLNHLDFEQIHHNRLGSLENEGPAINLKITHATEIWKIFMNQTNLHDFGFNIWIFQCVFSEKLIPPQTFAPWFPGLEESRDRSNRGIESNGVAEVQPVNGERPY